MSNETRNNKRIAKNTIYLYLRMVIVTGIGLYTSRVILNVLGVSDYGVFNVMGGIIGMLVYVNSLLSGATSRFITIDIAKGNIVALKQTFSMTRTLALIASIIIFILGETVGLWFMLNKLNIEDGRLYAASWVYQCALIACLLSVLQTPYQAAIIAHEKMNIYAYMTIFDAIMRLFVVFLLSVFSFDKLIIYAVLTLVIAILDFVLYHFICHIKFEECSFSFSFCKRKFQEMLNYSGWNMIGAFANILNNAGFNILINIFFGTVVNAARGIALQVNNVVVQVYSNFQMASRPQIFKYYAQGDVDSMSRLICNSSKYSAFLLLIILIPLCFSIKGILLLWLGQDVQYTSWFVRVMVLQVLFQAIDLPVGMGIHAVGNMKLANLTTSFLYISVFPITYLIYSLGANPITGYVVYLSFTPFILLVDLWLLKKYTGFRRIIFVKNVLFPVAVIGFIGCIFPIVIKLLVNDESIWTTILTFCVNALYVTFVVFFMGLTKSVKENIVSKVINVMERIKFNMFTFCCLKKE
jgi:O-antigen/teichoic acid export membrane protein